MRPAFAVLHIIWPLLTSAVLCVLRTLNVCFQACFLSGLPIIRFWRHHELDSYDAVVASPR